MRPFREFGPAPPDDQESLQTDVMRFIAILGLCLAAIFSLVNAAEMEQAQAPQARPQPPVAEPTVVVRPVAAAAAPEQPSPDKPSPERPRQEQLQPQQPPPVKPPPAKPPVAEPPVAEPPVAKPSVAAPRVEAPPPAAKKPAGFTLQFASSAAMQSLLAKGAIEVFAHAEDTFWQLDAAGRFAPARAPTSYYQMHPDTLPEPIRYASLQLGEPSGLAWGVTLPPSTAAQIQRLMQGRTGGDLLIDAAARVSLSR